MKSPFTLIVVLASVCLVRVARADVNQPIEIIDRSRTLPQNELELEAQLIVARIAGVDTGTVMTSSSTATGVGFFLGYGFGPELEGDIGYQFGLSPSTGKGPLSFGIAYNLVHAAGFTAAADARSGYDFGTSSVLPLDVGFDAQLKVTEAVAVFTPGHQLTVGLSGDNPIGINLPIGVRFQATPQVFVDAQTNIAYLAISDSSTRTFGADLVPLQLDAFYSFTRALDAGITFADDLKAAGDSYLLVFSLRAFH